MSRTATALALVPSAGDKPVTRAQRLKANQEAVKAEAAQGLTDLVAQIAAVVEEARDMATVETYSAETREALKQFAAYGTGSIDALGRQPKR